MTTRFRFLGGTHPTERLCTLADGIYAIALTLLVLALKVPEAPGISNPQLRADLFEQLPNFIAYAVAFLVVAIFWINHHRIFRSVTVCDERALWLNLFHLLFISLTPYMTSLIGHYKEDRIAAIMFSLNLGLSSWSLTWLARYVLEKEAWRTKESGGAWIGIPGWAFAAGPVCAVASILLSFANITAALLLWPVLMAGYGMFLAGDGPGEQRVKSW